jgi:hypothetical protein
MLVELYVMMWVTVLIFTVFALMWPERLFFPLFSAFLWWTFSSLSNQISYIGMGSVNAITQAYVIGDPIGGDVGIPVYLPTVFQRIGLVMFIYGVGVLFMRIRKGAQDVSSGRSDTLGGGV